jgi:hypothetical protein
MCHDQELAVAGLTGAACVAVHLSPGEAPVLDELWQQLVLGGSRQMPAVSNMPAPPCGVAGGTLQALRCYITTAPVFATSRRAALLPVSLAILAHVAGSHAVLPAMGRDDSYPDRAQLVETPVGTRSQLLSSLWSVCGRHWVRTHASELLATVCQRDHIARLPRVFEPCRQITYATSTAMKRCAWSFAHVACSAHAHGAGPGLGAPDPQVERHAAWT